MLKTRGDGFRVVDALRSKEARRPELAMLSAVSSSAAKSLMRKST
jgi:hypothetical protein